MPIIYLFRKTIHSPFLLKYHSLTSQYSSRIRLYFAKLFILPVQVFVCCMGDTMHTICLFFSHLNDRTKVYANIKILSMLKKECTFQHNKTAELL